MKKFWPVWVIVAVLILDQASKLWIKTNMQLGQEFQVFGNWFIIHFTENNGMAFGIELAGKYGKLLLTLVRLIAVSGIAYFLITLIQAPTTKKGALISVSLVLAGALGNIIDSVFYGVFFNYAPLFYGKVVDMLYFPFYEGFLPSWIPFWGDSYFVFFRPVFNIADMAISTGIGMILVFQNRYFGQDKNKSPKEDTTNLLV